MLTLTFAWIKCCVYGDVDIDAENGYRTDSLHLRFVTIASIIFENANVDIDIKYEWAFKIDVNIDATVTCEQALNANVKPKKIKEQSEEIKEKIRFRIRFCSL